MKPVEVDKRMVMIHHVAIRVTDIQRTSDFYTKNFDMEVTRDTIMELPQYATIFGLTASPRVHIRFLRPRGESVKSVMEVMQFLSSGEPVFPQGVLHFSYANNYIGTIHFAMQVDDIQGLYERLTRQGIKFNCPPQTYSIQGVGNVAVTYFKDPDGILVELVEIKS